jgi:hypothetical protein
MGDRHPPKTPLAWQGTLAQMKAHGTSVAQTSSCGCVGSWRELDLDHLISKYGPNWMLWDQAPRCARCGKRGHYMASPGLSTAYRPLKSGYDQARDRKAFLASFGFSRRDIVRIKAMADSVTALLANVRKRTAGVGEAQEGPAARLSLWLSLAHQPIWTAPSGTSNPVALLCFAGAAEGVSNGRGRSMAAVLCTRRAMAFSPYRQRQGWDYPRVSKGDRCALSHDLR